jgi:regulatory protein
LRELHSNRRAGGRRSESSASPLSPVETALRFLGPRRRFEREVQSHLRSKGFSKDEIVAAIERVRELGVLNDPETARAWLKDRLRFGPKGRSLLQAQLVRSGVAPSIADEALTEVLKENPEIETAVAVLRKMIARGTRSRENRADVLRRRMWSALGRRGFDPETTREAIAQVLGEQEEE